MFIVFVRGRVSSIFHIFVNLVDISSTPDEVLALKELMAFRNSPSKAGSGWNIRLLFVI